MVTEKELLKEKMLAGLVFMSEQGHCFETIWSHLASLIGYPKELYEDITSELQEKNNWSGSEMIDYMLTFHNK